MLVIENITIHTDSQAALRTLKSNTQSKVKFCWILGHSDVEESQKGRQDSKVRRQKKNRGQHTKTPDQIS